MQYRVVKIVNLPRGPDALDDILLVDVELPSGSGPGPVVSPGCTCTATALAPAVNKEFERNDMEREMLACPDCGNSKGNTAFYRSTTTTYDIITYHRVCKKCGQQFKTYHTKLNPYDILDEIQCKADELRRNV